jgi:hypothetical protein
MGEEISIHKKKDLSWDVRRFSRLVEGGRRGVASLPRDGEGGERFGKGFREAGKAENAALKVENAA